MNTQTIIFAYKVIVISHSFNGNAAFIEIEGAGVIHTGDENTQLLPEETIVSLIRLAHILRPISMRLLANGYTLCNGRLVKTEQVENKYDT